MKVIYFVCLLFLGVGLLNAKDIPLDTPTVVTGKLSVSKLGVYITTEDTVSGPGNGFKLSHEPVHHFMVSLDALSPEKQKVRTEELKKAAAADQTVTLHGSYEPLSERAQPYWGCRAFLELSE